MAVDFGKLLEILQQQQQQKEEVSPIAPVVLNPKETEFFRRIGAGFVGGTLGALPGLGTLLTAPLGEAAQKPFEEASQFVREQTRELFGVYEPADTVGDKIADVVGGLAGMLVPIGAAGSVARVPKVAAALQKLSVSAPFVARSVTSLLEGIGAEAATEHPTWRGVAGMVALDSVLRSYRVARALQPGKDKLPIWNPTMGRWLRVSDLSGDELAVAAVAGKLKDPTAATAAFLGGRAFREMWREAIDGGAKVVTDAKAPYVRFGDGSVVVVADEAGIARAIAGLRDGKEVVEVGGPSSQFVAELFKVQPPDELVTLVKTAPTGDVARPSIIFAERGEATPKLVAVEDFLKDKGLKDNVANGQADIAGFVFPKDVGEEVRDEVAASLAKEVYGNRFVALNEQKLPIFITPTPDKESRVVWVSAKDWSTEVRKVGEEAPSEDHFVLNILLSPQEYTDPLKRKAVIQTVVGSRVRAPVTVDAQKEAFEKLVGTAYVDQFYKDWEQHWAAATKTAAQVDPFVLEKAKNVARVFPDDVMKLASITFDASEDFSSARIMSSGRFEVVVAPNSAPEQIEHEFGHIIAKLVGSLDDAKRASFLDELLKELEVGGAFDRIVQEIIESPSFRTYLSYYAKDAFTAGGDPKKVIEAINRANEQIVYEEFAAWFLAKAAKETSAAAEVLRKYLVPVRNVSIAATKDEDAKIGVELINRASGRFVGLPYVEAKLVRYGDEVILASKRFVRLDLTGQKDLVKHFGDKSPRFYIAPFNPDDEKDVALVGSFYDKSSGETMVAKVGKDYRLYLLRDLQTKVFVLKDPNGKVRAIITDAVNVADYVEPNVKVGDKELARRVYKVNVAVVAEKAGVDPSKVSVQLDPETYEILRVMVRGGPEEVEAMRAALSNVSQAQLAGDAFDARLFDTDIKLAEEIAKHVENGKVAILSGSLTKTNVSIKNGAFLLRTGGSYRFNDGKVHWVLESPAGTHKTVVTDSLFAEGEMSTFPKEVRSLLAVGYRVRVVDAPTVPLKDLGLLATHLSHAVDRNVLRVSRELLDVSPEGVEALIEMAREKGYIVNFSSLRKGYLEVLPIDPAAGEARQLASSAELVEFLRGVGVPDSVAAGIDTRLVGAIDRLLAKAREEALSPKTPTSVSLVTRLRSTLEDTADTAKLIAARGLLVARVSSETISKYVRQRLDVKKLGEDAIPYAVYTRIGMAQEESMSRSAEEIPKLVNRINAVAKTTEEKKLITLAMLNYVGMEKEKLTEVELARQLSFMKANSERWKPEYDALIQELRRYFKTTYRELQGVDPALNEIYAYVTKMYDPSSINTGVLLEAVEEAMSLEARKALQEYARRLPRFYNEEALAPIDKVMARYIAEKNYLLYLKPEVKRAYDVAAKYVGVARALADSGDKKGALVADTAARFVKSLADTASGKTGGESIVTAAIGGILEQSGVQTSSVRKFINTFYTALYANTLGLKASSATRNMISSVLMTMPVVGQKRYGQAIEMWHEFLKGKAWQEYKHPIYTAFLKEYDDARSRVIKALRTSTWAPQEYTEAIAERMLVGMRITEQHTRGIAFFSGVAVAEDVLRAARKGGVDLDTETVLAFFRTETRQRLKQVLKDVLEGRKSELVFKQEVGREMVRYTMWQYGPLETPMWFKSPAMRLLSMYSTWPINYASYLSTIFSRRAASSPYMRKVMARFAATQAIGIAVFSALGLYSPSMFAFGPLDYAGGPAATALADAYDWIRLSGSERDMASTRAIRSIATTLAPGGAGLRELARMSHFVVRGEYENALKMLVATPKELTGEEGKLRKRVLRRELGVLGEVVW